jgi:predicted nucleic acid-binding protein
VSLVLDSSAALAYCFDDERTPQIDAIFERVVEEGAIVPSLWRYEIANVLLLARRRGRVRETFPQAAFEQFEILSIVADDESDEQIWRATMRLAALYELTIYDAAYLELAQRKRLPLATLDIALAGAARAAGVEILGQ